MSNNGLFSRLFRNLFNSNSKSLQNKQNIDKLVEQACNEINNIIRHHAFELVYRGNLLGRYIDIRIADDMREVAIANTTFEKAIYIQGDDGKFTYPPTENPQEKFKITTTHNLTLNEKEHEEYLKKLFVNLQIYRFTVCASFRQLKDSNVLFSFADLGQMEDHAPDMMMFTDF